MFSCLQGRSRRLPRIVVEVSPFSRVYISRYHPVDNFVDIGADLMNSLADSLLLGSPTPEKRVRAETWIRKAIAVVNDTKRDNKRDPEAISHCELVLAAALFNLGSMREVCSIDNLSLCSTKLRYLI